MKKKILIFNIMSLVVSSLSFAASDFSKIRCRAQDGILGVSGPWTRFEMENKADITESRNHGDYVYRVTNKYGDYLYSDANGNERHESLVEITITDQTTQAEVSTTAYLSQNISPTIKLKQSNGKYAQISCGNK